MPEHRQGKISLFRYLRRFRADLLSAQPEHLYRAKMAEFRTPFFRSYLLNQPDLVRMVLQERPDDFPKSDRVAEGLRPLLGNSVFLTNGETWKRQRRIIDPAFRETGLKRALPVMVGAGDALVQRLRSMVGRDIDIEPEMAHTAADVIFRTLFSVPITDGLAAEVYAAFRRYQRAQPIVNVGAFLPLPKWIPRFHRRAVRAAAGEIRKAIGDMVARRLDELRAGTAPDDLATRIMTTADPETGKTIGPEEMLDQVAIFFLAGHETAAAALAWALYLLSEDPAALTAAREEADGLPDNPTMADVAAMGRLRSAWRETLRLYPPVPMMVREATQPESFRKRSIPKGAQLVVSPWHLHRHEALWQAPHVFDIDRFDGVLPEGAYLPFSAGPRICPGAGFAMVEGPLLLALVIRAFHLRPASKSRPVPVAHLTVRSRDGIFLRLAER
ncbi:MAG: cytochrome P450 [Pseudomonadota bacterium]